MVGLPTVGRDNSVSTTAFSAVSELHDGRPTIAPGLGRLAVLAAATLHLAVFLWLFHPWRSALEHVPPADLPVTLVFEPPPKPPAAAPETPPKPQPKPQSPPSAFDRESGPDAQTTAPPVAPDDVAGEAKRSDTPQTPPESAAVPPPPAVPTVPVPARPTPTKMEPPRPTARPKDQKTPPRAQADAAAGEHARPLPDHIAPGERRTSGDPYLNAVSRELAKHRYYPDLARPLGLKGVARFIVLIDRAGRLIAMQLVLSSGSDLLDRAAEKQIRDTLPFPPVPPEYPENPVEITMGIYVGPM